MNVLPILSSNNVPKISFKDVIHYKDASDFYMHTMKDEFVSDRVNSLVNYRKYLEDMGVKASIRDNYLELKSMENYASDKDYDIDSILKMTKKIIGSVDFGAIGAKTLGSVEELIGKWRYGGSRFSIATSEIDNIGSLRNVYGLLIISKEQYLNMDFSGLRVTGDIYIQEKGDKENSYKFTRLSKEEKMRLLGFEQRL